RIEVVREPMARPKRSTVADLSDAHSEVLYSPGRLNPYGAVGPDGILLNPDETLRRLSGGDTRHYREMDRRHGWLAGLADQRVERSNYVPVIVPGDATDPRSVQMAKEMRLDFERIPSSAMLLGRQLRDARLVCGWGVLENVWGRSFGTGNITIMRYIDRPAEAVRFDDEWRAYVRTPGSPFKGELAPPLKLSIMRGGTHSSPYGSPEYKEVSFNCFVIEQLLLGALENIGKHNLPLPVARFPRVGLDKKDRGNIKVALKTIFKRVLSVPTDDQDFSLEFPTMQMAANLGEVELKHIEWQVTMAYIRINRVPQTLNKTGGSRALETTRLDISSDAARLDAGEKDSNLNENFATPYCDINYPNEPAELLPRFSTPTYTVAEIEQYHRFAMNAVTQGVRVSKRAYFERTGLTEAMDSNDVLGRPDLRAAVGLGEAGIDPEAKPNTSGQEGE
ncbi:MAG TPA: DUF935 family protein, partial [Thermoanaerobaculia bacterium]